jgi:hypothetical protein
VSFLSWIYQELGQYQKSADTGVIATRKAPDHVFGYNNLAWAYVQLNQLDKAEATIRDAEAHKLYFPEFAMIRFTIGFLKGDQAAMDRLAAAAAGKVGEEDWMYAFQAAALAYRGKLKEAKVKLTSAVALDRQPAQQERAASYVAGAAVQESFFGKGVEARQDAAKARSLSHGRDVEYGAALALALAGDTAEPKVIADSLADRFKDDTLVKAIYLPTIGALLALHNDPGKAIELLEASAPFDLSAQGGATGFYGDLYTAYVRGLALKAQKRGAEAAVQFQKVLDTPGMVSCDPVGAMARLELARALFLAGDTAKAKAAYKGFLDLWKDADHDVPILIKAKAESDALR